MSRQEQARINAVAAELFDSVDNLIERRALEEQMSPDDKANLACCVLALYVARWAANIKDDHTAAENLTLLISDIHAAGTSFLSALPIAQAIVDGKAGRA